MASIASKTTRWNSAACGHQRLQLQALLSQIIKRVMKALTRHGALIEEGMTYLAEIESDVALAPLQSAACTYRIALGPRAGQKLLTLKTVATQNLEQSGQEYCDVVQ